MANIEKQLTKRETAFMAELPEEYRSRFEDMTRNERLRIMDRMKDMQDVTERTNTLSNIFHLDNKEAMDLQVDTRATQAELTKRREQLREVIDEKFKSEFYVNNKVDILGTVLHNRNNAIKAIIGATVFGNEDDKAMLTYKSRVRSNYAGGISINAKLNRNKQEILNASAKFDHAITEKEKQDALRAGREAGNARFDYYAKLIQPDNAVTKELTNDDPTLLEKIVRNRKTNKDTTDEVYNQDQEAHAYLLSIHDAMDTKDDILKARRNNVKNQIVDDYFAMLQQQFSFKEINMESIDQLLSVGAILYMTYRPFRDEINYRIEDVKDAQRDRQAKVLSDQADAYLVSNGGDLSDPYYQELLKKQNALIRERDGRDMWLPETAALQSISFDKEYHDELAVAYSHHASTKECEHITAAYEAHMKKLQEEMQADGISMSDFTKAKVKAIVDITNTPKVEDGTTKYRSDIATLYAETADGQFAFDAKGNVLNMKALATGDLENGYIESVTPVLQPEENIKMLENLRTEYLQRYVGASEVEKNFVEKAVVEKAKTMKADAEMTLDRFIDIGLRNNYVAPPAWRKTKDAMEADESQLPDFSTAESTVAYLRDHNCRALLTTLQIDDDDEKTDDSPELDGPAF